MTHDFIMESWDVSTAFLRGFNFEIMEKMAADLGINLPELKRKAHIVPPANVWFHLAEMGFVSHDMCFLSYCLELLKAMYGLVDAPLLW